MSSFNLAKKLQPAKKAWKSFTKTLQSRLQKLKISKAIKKTTRSLKFFRSLRPFIPHKLRRLTPRHNKRRHRHRRHQLQKNSATIYVDELFAGPVSLHAKQIHPHHKEMGATSSSGENRAKVEAKTMTNVQKQQQHVHALGSKNMIDEKVLSRSGGADPSKAAAVSSVPQWQGIDQRAEEFISKFREDMKLQREQSILDFQEMLARSA